MQPLISAILPEVILVAVACVLFLIGITSSAHVRKAAPVLAVIALMSVFALQLFRITGESVPADPWNTFRVDALAQYVKLLVSGVGVLLVLVAWPISRTATRSPGMDLGQETGEFFGLMLLSITGVFLVAGANDLILFFLGIELASIPTYIMVSISRPLPQAQEAGVKYFFLGAMSAALLLFGFSYLFGSTGLIHLDQIGSVFQNSVQTSGGLTGLQMLGVLMVLCGLAFKMAAVPLHFYAADVYQGAATQVTAFLSFIPKTTGLIAIVKLLQMVGGPDYAIPAIVVKLLLVVAILTMTAGNVLGLLQHNVKRVLAYSSVAHSGYLLAAVAALAGAHNLLPASEAALVHQSALVGLLFYIGAYGVMSVASFGILTLLPSRGDEIATSAETFDDLTGTGRSHLILGLCMAIACFGLTGVPLTTGFIGKIYILRPALELSQLSTGMFVLVIAIVVNAAISAAYYLKIVNAMFVRTDHHLAAHLHGGHPAHHYAGTHGHDRPGHEGLEAAPIRFAVVLACAITLMMGIPIFPFANAVTDRVREALVHPATKTPPFASASTK